MLVKVMSSFGRSCLAAFIQEKRAPLCAAAFGQLLISRVACCVSLLKYLPLLYRRA